MRLGRRGAIGEYTLLVMVAYAVPVATVAQGLVGIWGLLPLATLPLAARLTLQVSRETGRALNAALVSTARLLLGFGLLLAAGIVLGARGP